MFYDKLDDKTIISILKQALLDKTIGDDLLSIASMTIELFESEDESRRLMARSAAKPIVSKYINLTETNINREEISIDSFKNTAATYISEIKNALENKLLDDNVASNIAIILEDLTKEGVSLEEIRNAIFYYEVCFRPAVESAPINPNSQKKKRHGRS